MATQTEGDNVNHDDMRSFQFREENGYLPDDVYTPSVESADDPDHHEIAALVIEQYAHNNAKRHAEHLRGQVAALTSLLAEHGIGVPDDL